MTTRQEALEHISGQILDDMVVYYADETDCWYTCDADDLDYLAELLDHDDDSIRGDAYSHWCASTTSTEYAVRMDADDLADFDWRQCPADGGQIVDVKYAMDGESYFLYRRRHDRSDNTCNYQRAELDQDDSEFEPWNGSLPNHGEWQEILTI